MFNDDFYLYKFTPDLIVVISQFGHYCDLFRSSDMPAIFNFDVFLQCESG